MTIDPARRQQLPARPGVSPEQEEVMSRTVRIILTTVLMLLIGLLVLQALAYGIGFAFDPEGNAGDFGYEAPDPVDELTLELVRAVGISMIGSAALLAFSAILIWRATPAGAYLAMIIGTLYVVVAFRAVAAERWWDAGFYGITGVALIVLSGAAHWLQARPGPGATGPALRPCARQGRRPSTRISRTSRRRSAVGHRLKKGQPGTQPNCTWPCLSARANGQLARRCHVAVGTVRSTG